MEKILPLTEILQEIELASIFKANGKEGQSRVTARRAAGKAVRFWLNSENLININVTSPFQALEIARNSTSIPDNIRVSLLNLTKKINIDYSFPENMDLINDATVIVAYISEKVSNDR